MDTVIKTVPTVYPVCVKSDNGVTKWVNLAHVMAFEDRKAPNVYQTDYIKLIYQNGEIDIFSGIGRETILGAIALLEAKALTTTEQLSNDQPIHDIP
jgi:hypothetical protein